MKYEIKVFSSIFLSFEIKKKIHTKVGQVTIILRR